MKRTDRCKAFVVALQIVLVVGMWICTFASTSAAEDYGKKFYLQYCSACHGPGGKGDGVVSQLMTPKPTDLTQLTKKAGGRFPFYEMIRVIDGRETVRGHGDANMPVWGALFQAEEGTSWNAQAVARGKVVLIADHLESIQEK